ncbi:MAG: serine/threonine protein kinase [Acidobacteria bacterium]|nr:serine/threonine protein kinase [Acidobacteriota bacterium]
MNASNWSIVKELVSDILDVEPGSRASYLKSLRLDPGIQCEVEELLSFAGDEDSIIDSSAFEITTKVFANGIDTADQTAGQTVGPYTIVGELGLGGMGAVYLAERSDGKFEQQVALKLLKRELNTKKTREMFRREVEILSQLNHPNIASLIDIGTTEDGIPYIVMEFVDGMPIDKYCSENGLGLIQRLKLFNRVCSTVAFAHKNLIIHRDIKPTNILVNGSGEPVLLDFGISKIMEGTDPDRRDTTFIGALTPDYASPEQARNEPVTTAADIYSLGVVLYKLLTGSTPGLDRNAADTDAGRSEIRPPSLAEFPAGHPVHRSEVAGDLDNIVAKAIDDDPQQRYGTVQQLEDDIWRFIDGEPVLARPATLLYRTKKFIKRHRFSAAAAIVVLLSLITGTGLALWQADVAQAHAAAAETESEKAKSEQIKAEKISSFMAKIISYGNPAWYGEGYRFGGEAKVIEALYDLSDKIDVEFEGQADIQAELHHKFAEVFAMAARSSLAPTESEKLMKKYRFHALRALELRKQYYGDWHELVAKDIFYSYAITAENEPEMAQKLDHAIRMMRATNPMNLNLPYMLEAYAARLVSPEVENLHLPFLNAVTPDTDVSNFEVGERYLREALILFRLHYKEENYAIIANTCMLAYALAKQEKWGYIEEPLAACRRGVANSNTQGRVREIIYGIERLYRGRGK